jgi:molybdopterin-guanine dinucleotide biosynthesis protein B
MPKIVSFVGKSDSGKTTLLSKLIPVLKDRGYRIGVIKHAHHGFNLDREGKDSDVYGKAGADGVMLASPFGMALMIPFAEEKPLDRLLPYFSDMDLIITEGYKKSPYPKIEVFRREKHGTPLGNSLENLIAIVTDDPVESGLPVFSPGDISGLADFIRRNFLS